MAANSFDEFLEAVPSLPQPASFQGTTEKAIRVATPDLILFDEEGFPVDMMLDLIFEQIGGQEIINIARNDIINGQKISYSLISNADKINNAYNTKNIFSVPNTLDSFFKNFAIRLEIHVPEEGTAPLLYYVGELASRISEGCEEYPIINRKTNELIACYANLLEARNSLEELSPPRDTVYIDTAGGLVVDVTRMGVNERVEIQVLNSGQVLSDILDVVEES